MTVTDAADIVVPINRSPKYIQNTFSFEGLYSGGHRSGPPVLLKIILVFG
jgi:hypothetical protein